jgi:hypothetical protein
MAPIQTTLSPGYPSAVVPSMAGSSRSTLRMVSKARNSAARIVQTMPATVLLPSAVPSIETAIGFDVIMDKPPMRIVERQQRLRFV